MKNKNIYSLYMLFSLCFFTPTIQAFSVKDFFTTIASFFIINNDDLETDSNNTHEFKNILQKEQIKLYRNQQSILRNTGGKFVYAAAEGAGHEIGAGAVRYFATKITNNRKNSGDLTFDERYQVEVTKLEKQTEAVNHLPPSEVKTTLALNNYNNAKKLGRPTTSGKTNPFEIISNFIDDQKNMLLNNNSNYTHYEDGNNSIQDYILEKEHQYFTTLHNDVLVVEKKLLSLNPTYFFNTSYNNDRQDLISDLNMLLEILSMKQTVYEKDSEIYKKIDDTIFIILRCKYVLTENNVGSNNLQAISTEAPPVKKGFFSFK